jgi:hypothetical protein
MRVEVQTESGWHTRHACRPHLPEVTDALIEYVTLAGESLLAGGTTALHTEF